MTAYSIQTNLDPDQLNQVAVEVYKKWMEFALGRVALGGKFLKHPNGKYAAAISWRKTGKHEVTIVADSAKTPEVEWVEKGAKAFSIKDAMLAKKSHVSADGYRYRVVPLPPSQDDTIRESTILPQMPIESFITGSAAKGQKVKVSVAKIWAQPIKRTQFRTMTDRPGSAEWKMPERPAYAPAKILADLLTQEYVR